MKVQIRHGEKIKYYEGELKDSLINEFIWKHFGLLDIDYSIKNIDTHYSQHIMKLSQFCIKPLMKWELLVETQTAEQALPEVIKRILRSKVEYLDAYVNKNTEELFRYARANPKLFDYPFFERFNIINRQLTTLGAQKYINQYKNSQSKSTQMFKYGRQQKTSQWKNQCKIVKSYVLKLCSLQSPQCPNTFLNEYFNIPCDLEESMTRILEKETWRLASNLHFENLSQGQEDTPK